MFRGGRLNVVRRRTVVLAGLGALGVVAALGCAGALMGASHLASGVLESVDEEIGPEQLDAMGKAAYLRFPEGTGLLRAHYHHWQEWRLSLRVTVPRSSFDGFVTDNGLPAPVPGLRPEPIVRGDPTTSAHDEGWRPLAHASVSGIESAEHGDVFRALMFGFDEPATVEVYLLAHDV